MQAAGVLAKAHPIGLVHGSLRPDHLFLIEAAGQPFLKIANFGDVSSESVPCGPATEPPAPSFLRQQPYLTPEQILHGRSDAAAADLWALGVTLYELLTTTLPFEAPTPAGVNAAICNGQFSPPSHYRADLPAPVDAWFARVLAKEPAARFRDPGELARELERALSGLAAAPAVMRRESAALERELPPPSSNREFEDERTVRWELPGEWDQPRPGSELGSAFPPEPQRPSSGSLSVPPPLPDRPSSYPPPMPGGDAPGSYYPGLRLQPLSPAYASLSPVRAPLAVAPARATALPAGLTKTKGVIMGSLLGAVLTLSVWGYQTLGDGSEGAAPDLSAETRTAPLESADGAARAASNGATVPRMGSSRPLRANLTNEDLPVVQSDELPRAPDDEYDAEGSVLLPESNVGFGARGPAAGSAASAARGSSVAPAPVEPKRADARPDPAPAAVAAVKPGVPSRAVPARAVPRRVPPRKSTKPVSSADCNPPYFFDSNNIRRLKLECL
jgi:hypothetical protein